jgi:branched-chain amino acid transport system ATP-binding protein
LASDILELRDIDTFYGDSHVLYGVGLTLPKGCLLGLLGRNGAGKTTCLSTIMGLLRPRRGSIHLNAVPIHQLPPEAISREGISLVPQGRRIFKSLTVRENLAVALHKARAGSPLAPWTLERIFAVFPRLKERQNQTAGLMSGGEQQMLAIGRALMTNPQVLLLDEPSEGLAPQIVAEVGKVISTLKAEGLSIILVEQNVKMTLNLCDEIAVMNTGQIAYRGTPADFAGNPDLAARLLGVF